mmetsp:Transcript_41197/g.116557  ORF Transcript_41197/g.116557 Transcript_41197/m.116557 type:complete len:393 (+) Transcript_41197:71-1249(+)
MARRRGVLVSLALLLAAPSCQGEDVSPSAALDADDECAAGDEQCALNALQLRGARLAPERADPSDDTEFEAAAAKKPKKKKDLSPAWAEELEGKIKQLMHDVNGMEKKLLYLNMDLESTNGTLFDVPNATRGVNGTYVTWTDHSAEWYPRFSLLQRDAPVDTEELPQADLPPDEDEPEYLDYDDDEDDEDDDSLQSNAQKKAPKTKKGKGKKKPHVNLHRKVKAEMAFQQNRLTEFWGSLMTFESQITAMNEFMTNTPRKFNGSLVLSEVAAEKPKKKKKHCHWGMKHGKCKKPKPQDDILESLDLAGNTTRLVWDTIHQVDLEMETLKRRVGRFKAGQPVTTTTTTTIEEATTATTTKKSALDVPVPSEDGDEEDDDDDRSEEVVALAQQQ